MIAGGITFVNAIRPLNRMFVSLANQLSRILKLLWCFLIHNFASEVEPEGCKNDK